MQINTKFTNTLDEARAALRAMVPQDQPYDEVECTMSGALDMLSVDTGMTVAFPDGKVAYTTDIEAGCTYRFIIPTQSVCYTDGHFMVIVVDIDS